MENYLSLTILLVSTCELFITSYLKHYFPDLVEIITIDDKSKEMINIEKLNFPLSDADELWIFEGKYINLNWRSYSLIIREACCHNIEKFEFLNELMETISSLKHFRNLYIHEGIPINKVTINKALKTNSQLKSIQENCNSQTLKALIKEISKMDKQYYYNWVPVLQEELIKRMQEYSTPLDE